MYVCMCSELDNYSTLDTRHTTIDTQQSTLDTPHSPTNEKMTLSARLLDPQNARREIVLLFNFVFVVGGWFDLFIPIL